MSAFLRAVCLFMLIGAGPALSDLSDGPVRNELANDGLSNLLERAFVVDHVPHDQQVVERDVIALRDLSDARLTPPERSAALSRIASQLNEALGQIDDPQLLLSASALLDKEGVEQDVNVLEYFGEDGNEQTKSRLRPIIATTVALYDRAVNLLNAQQSQLQDKIVRPGDEAAIQWQKVYEASQTAAYTRWMLSYAQALSLDRGDPQRVSIVDQAMQNLQQWDDPDSGVQAIVRFQTAKLLMLKGTHESLSDAKNMLRTVWAAGPREDKAVQPSADRYTQFLARYFLAVRDLLDRDDQAARRDALAADRYRRLALPDVVEDEWAMDMLHYRMALAEGRPTDAVKILEDLSDRAPSLRVVIARQLLERLPPHPDIASLSPLMLSALMERASAELSQPGPNRDVLDRGLAAAQQYLSRADSGDPQTTPRSTVDASKIRGVILAAEGKHDQAAAAFLDHARRYKDEPSAQAAEALDQAIGQIALVYRDGGSQTHQSDVSDLEEQLLPLAVESFHRYDLAYEYARRLQRAGQFAKAAGIFDLVPRDDPNAFNALFFKMLALNQRLYSGPQDIDNQVIPGDLPTVVSQIEALADQIIHDVRRRPVRTQQLQTIQVRTALLAADVAAHQGHDPQRTLALLRDFESAASGLPDEKSLLAEALSLRITAYLAAGQADQATATLVQYLSSVGGNEGLGVVYNLLTKLNADLDQAKAAGQTARVKELALDRAALTPFLVSWAQSNSNPDIRKYTYRYRVFDAATQAQAGELETDPAARKQMLNDALAKYQQLQSPQNVQLYQDSLPTDATPDVREYPDPQVTLGIGNVAFAMEDWKLVHDSIGQLLADSKLGDGTTITKNAAGQDEQVDNDQFWEAEYKFIYATMELSKDPSSGVSIDTPRTMLGQLEVVWEDRIGGEKWHGKFNELARMLKTPKS